MCILQKYKKKWELHDNSIKNILLFFLNIIYTPHFLYNSTFANGEVKEVREVKAICFIAKNTTKKRLLSITSNDRME